MYTVATVDVLPPVVINVARVFEGTRQGWHSDDPAFTSGVKTHMSLAILRLDLAGQPRGWCSPEETATAYVKGDISWTLGEPAITLHGGVQRMTGMQSVLEIPPIVAMRGRVVGNFSISLNNKALFRRDQHICLYCGNEMHRSLLTRDHVVPVSRGGRDIWANCVTACKSCNNRKGNRTPEEATMPLLAVPFTPNPWEYTFLERDRILGDQMDYLRQQFSQHRNWTPAAG